MDQNAKQRIVEKIKSATNVLVTVSRDPSVDQLATAIGTTLMINAMDAHATTVFSGEVPNVLEFLDPEKSIDSTVDRLRDFIISIDKEKADKLRYKVEDNVVRIYITPYKTTISEDDLTFSQGDFNVDVVLALGVNNKAELDQAISAHGRILHDATIASITAGTEEDGDLGAVNWHDPAASSLAEMMVSMSEALQSGILDKGMATAFLTGIVSATDRFSNPKTSPKVMTMAAQLMAAGADQQVISKNLRMDRGRASDLGDQTKPKKDDSVLDLHKRKAAETKHPQSTSAHRLIPDDQKDEKPGGGISAAAQTGHQKVSRALQPDDDAKPETGEEDDGDLPSISDIEISEESKDKQTPSKPQAPAGADLQEVLKASSSSADQPGSEAEKKPDQPGASGITSAEKEKPQSAPSTPPAPQATSQPESTGATSTAAEASPTETQPQPAPVDQPASPVVPDDNGVDAARNDVEAALSDIDFTPDESPPPRQPAAPPPSSPEPAASTDNTANDNMEIQIDPSGELHMPGSGSPRPPASTAAPARSSLPPSAPPSTAPKSTIPQAWESLEPTTDTPNPAHQPDPHQVTSKPPPPSVPPPIPAKPADQSPAPSSAPPPGPAKDQPPPQQHQDNDGGHRYMTDPPGSSGNNNAPQNPLFS